MQWRDISGIRVNIQIFRLLRLILGGRYFATLEFPVPFIMLTGALKCTSKHDLRIRPIYHWTPRLDSGAHCNLLYMGVLLRSVPASSVAGGGQAKRVRKRI